MFNPTIEQIEFELNRLNSIDYDTVFKYFQVTQDRIIRVRKLILDLSPTYKSRLELLAPYNRIVDKFNNYCNQANGTPQSY